MSFRGLTISTRSPSRSRSRNRTHRRSVSRSPRRSVSRSPRLPRLSLFVNNENEVSHSIAEPSDDYLEKINRLHLGIQYQSVPYDILCKRITGQNNGPCSIIFNKVNKIQSNVLMGHHRIGANRYVKIYYFNIPGVFTLRTFYNEVYLQSKASMLHHPDFSVPKIYDYGQVTPILNDPERPGWVMVYFIMEYINGYCLIPSDLERVEPHLTGCRRVKRNVLSHRISSIDEWLQTNGIYHNDLNFGNILKVRDGKYYIIDFGESSEYPKTFAHMRNTSRTRRHRIPYTPH